MPTEVWWRQPEYYVKEMIELHENKIAFDIGYLVNWKTDPERWADAWYGSQDYRMLLVGRQGTQELRPGRGRNDPVAVYPTWAFGEDFDALEELCQRNIAEDEDARTNLSIPHELRPREGQEHRVIVTDLPHSNLGPVRRVLKLVQELQEDYFDCIIHVHGLYGFRSMFSGGYGAVDYDPRALAKKGKVVLGSGKEMTYEQAARNPQWVNLVGYRTSDLQIPRNRCMFNMKSALWAADNFRENIKFKATTYKDVSKPQTATSLQPTTGRVLRGHQPVLSGDKFLCDTCSLQNTCKYFRVGSVCSIPGSEPSELVRMFKTRSADDIIDGLGNVMAVQASRLQRGVESEEEYDELDPEVTKIINSLMTHGNKLAKLLNPALNTPKVGVFVGPGGTVQPVIDPKKVTAQVVRALEAQGIDRDKITPEMIMQMIGQGDQVQAIDVRSEAS